MDYRHYSNLHREKQAAENFLRLLYDHIILCGLWIGLGIVCSSQQIVYTDTVKICQST